MPAAPFAEAHKIFMEDIGETVGQFFSSFDEEPIGSASIAQVYKARLPASPELQRGEPDGQAEVAVKIRRPGVEKVFEADFLIISFWPRSLICLI